MRLATNLQLEKLLPVSFRPELPELSLLISPNDRREHHAYHSRATMIFFLTALDLYLDPRLELTRTHWRLTLKKLLAHLTLELTDIIRNE